MNKRTLKALRGSIAKWEGILSGKVEDRQDENCPLCKLFNNGMYGCAGCPVSEKTGRDWCGGTPYASQWMRACAGTSEWTGKTKRQKEAARAELTFLKSLLPRKKKRATQKKNGR